MANCGLPGTSGFVGEFMVILASFQQHPWIAGRGHHPGHRRGLHLWLVKRVIFGEVTNAHVAELKDVNPREALVLGVLSPSACWRWACIPSR
jgi:NADH-quinone oxidoreductase subunit M